ncbi:hypothetical protein KAU51_00845 [Candidatus Parcubacteria bacterium]|nr:hypothetical protein [Candidatus Parcubacteria bacterium]
MKIFISHKFRGVNKKSLRKKLEKISFVLEKSEHKTFIFFRDKKNWEEREFPSGQVILEAFSQIKKCDILFGFIDNQKMSESMLLEIGFAKALNKKIVLLISKKCSFPTLEAVSDRVIKFDDIKQIDKELLRIKV